MSAVSTVERRTSRRPANRPGFQRTRPWQAAANVTRGGAAIYLPTVAASFSSDFWSARQHISRRIRNQPGANECRLVRERGECSPRQFSMFVATSPIAPFICHVCVNPVGGCDRGGGDGPPLIIAGTLENYSSKPRCRRRKRDAAVW